jgi:pyruvate dehydrogenase E2 component (dihydrolipoamide acetyltransferase)
MIDKEIKIPNIGEFKNVEVIEVLVSNGQSISKNDPLITIESDKSSVEIPSYFEGKVKSVNIKVGDKVSEGDLMLTLESSEEIKKEPNIEKEKEKEKVKFKPQKKIINKDNEKSVLGVSSASPKTRKFARELGVDINQISGSERQGRVIENDVKNFISFKINNISEKKENQSKKIINEFSHSDFGEVEIKDIPRVKKLASTYLINSWTTIPHVTNHDEADITEMEDFRR